MSASDIRVAHLELRVAELERVLRVVMLYIDEGAKQHTPLRNWKSVEFFESETEVMQNCASCHSSRQYHLRPCGRCFSIRYCSEECQHAHWEVHANQCIPIEDARPLPPLSFSE